jgi:competence protein ComGC
MLKLKPIVQNRAGDTIIEVMLALTIISLVMVISYRSIDHTILNFEDQRENSQAAALVQSQIESLRVYDGTGGLDCFDTNGVAQPSPSNCLFDSSGSDLPAGSQTQPAFQVQITALVSNPGDYKVSASWTSLTNESDNITMYYGNQ